MHALETGRTWVQQRHAALSAQPHVREGMHPALWGRPAA